MNYQIKKGTEGKVLKHILLDNYDIKTWITRKELTFSKEACGINPEMLETNPEKYHADSLAVKLAQEGYAIFSDDEVFNEDALYFLAVPYNLVTIK